MQDIQNTLNHFRNYKDEISVKETVEFRQMSDIKTPCYNCYLDSSGSSTGVYNTSTGTEPFTNGVCPKCFGTGEISEMITAEIQCFSRNTANEFIRNRLGVSQNTIKVLFVAKKDIDDVFNTDKPIKVKISDEEFTVSEVLQTSFYSDRYIVSLSGGG